MLDRVCVCEGQGGCEYGCEEEVEQREAPLLVLVVGREDRRRAVEHDGEREVEQRVPPEDEDGDVVHGRRAAPRRAAARRSHARSATKTARRPCRRARRRRRCWRACSSIKTRL